MNYSNLLQNKLTPYVDVIASHPLYSLLTDKQNLIIFMEHHVYAVWDFMCLLKVLYHKIVCNTAPWYPPEDAFSAHLISKILIDEESDVTIDKKGFTSHFEIYLYAMEQLGANTEAIRNLLLHLKNGKSLNRALQQIHAPESAKNFILETFSLFELNAHALAAAFLYGREAITQSMFLPIVKMIEQHAAPCDRHVFEAVSYYFNRHIELDGESHFPEALQMLRNLCQEDKNKWLQAENAAIFALNARLKFFTAIKAKIECSMLINLSPSPPTYVHEAPAITFES